MIRSLRTAVGFLTPLPVGTAAPDAGTAVWFPVAGAGVGLVVGGAWWAAGEAFAPIVAAGLVVLVDAVVTGALHLDGLADSADGLLAHGGGDDEDEDAGGGLLGADDGHGSPADAAWRLAIMRAPDVGAFGVVALVVVLLLRWSTLVAIAPDVVLVAALWSASRAAMAVALVSVPYVGGGLGAAFLGARRGPVVAAGLVVPVGLAVLTDDPGVAVVSVAAAFVGAAGVVGLGRRRLGGVTGDVLGAAGVVAETVGLLVASASW